MIQPTWQVLAAADDMRILKARLRDYHSVAIPVGGMAVKADFRIFDPVAQKSDVVPEFHGGIADAVQNIRKIFVIDMIGKQNTNIVGSVRFQRTGGSIGMVPQVARHLPDAFGSFRVNIRLAVDGF